MANHDNVVKQLITSLQRMDIKPSFSEKGKTEPVDFETAILETGYGRFQGMLLCICGAIYATCAIGTTTLSFVLPSAECDFHLTSKDKGKLNATPLIGMVVGSYLWGSLAESRGRKFAIILALLVDAAAAIFSSLAQTFPLFLACRFFNGFGIIGATSLVFPYLAEFLTPQHRDVMLCRLEVFWTMGIILVPGLAWIVIPQPWTIISAYGHFTYSSWRMFVALCGAPSLTVAALLCLFPESPKYLLSLGKMDQTLDVLRSMYRINTGKNVYPVHTLQLELDGISTVSVTVDGDGLPLTWRAKIKKKFVDLWAQNKQLFSAPYLQYILLACFTDFGLMSSYYTLMLWFPELFERFEAYGILHPNENAGVCDVSSVVIESDPTKCGEIDSKVFLYTMIVGISCIPTSVGLGLFINKLGKKFVLVFSLVTAGLAALGLNIVHSSVQNLVLSCIFEAVISVTEAVLFCVIVELFPTNLGALAMSVTVTCGRIGAIIGNMIFGALIDLNCVYPIFTFGCLLITSGILCLAFPKSTRPIISN